MHMTKSYKETKEIEDYDEQNFLEDISLALGLQNFFCNTRDEVE